MESHGRTPLSQRGPFSGVTLSGKQKIDNFLDPMNCSIGKHLSNLRLFITSFQLSLQKKLLFFLW